MNILMGAHFAGESLAIRSGAVATRRPQRWSGSRLRSPRRASDDSGAAEEVLRVAGEGLKPSPPARRDHCIGPPAWASHEAVSLEQLAWIE
jgi:hypothetical protein